MKTITLIACLALTSCGGTFIIPTPIGPVSYTTPQLVKVPIAIEK